MKNSAIASTIAAAALATFIALPSPAAHAATKTCEIPAFGTTCNTGVLRAIGNVIWTEVRNCYVTGIGSSVDWKLVDDNGVAVAYGTVPWGRQFQKTTTGLYSYYRLELRHGNPGARGRMLNTNPSWGGGWSDC